MVIVALDKSVNVKIVKEGTTELPINESFLLTDRILMLRTSPEGVSIKINGRFVAKGEYVTVAKGETVEILLEKEGLIPVCTKYVRIMLR